jgi:hypothetical protein
MAQKLAIGPTKSYAATRTLLKAWSSGGVPGKDLAPRLRRIPEDRAEIGHVAVLHMPSDLVDSISNVRMLRVADSCA